MKALVTGAAGFVGSHLCEALLSQGDTVIGVDALTDYYPPTLKRDNVSGCLPEPRFELVEQDLATADLDALLDGVEVVFHQAAQPGVRLSWATGFGAYVQHNIVATQRLLEACRRSPDLQRFVYASSSSVYGNRPSYPTAESEPTRPFSPYGVTKLAGEHLATAYGVNFAVPTVSLRYFTVYGPRQRPDMATHRFIASALTGAPVRLFGDGSNVRDFTFVGDVVAANLAAVRADLPPGEVFNVAGGGSTTVRALLDLIGEAVGEPVRIEQAPAQAGDVRQTGGSTDKAQRLIGWSPAVDLPSGVARQVEWQRSRPSAAPGLD